MFKVSFGTYFADALENLKPFENDGLLRISPKSIECSPTGTLLIRNIAMAFDAYMHVHAKSDKTFSKTV
jgi:oxygen-independent coproporphyrinogen-3 oxidase